MTNISTKVHEQNPRFLTVQHRCRRVKKFEGSSNKGWAESAPLVGIGLNVQPKHFLEGRARPLCLGNMHFLILDTLLDLKYKQDSFQGIKSVFEDSGKRNSVNKKIFCNYKFFCHKIILLSSGQIFELQEISGQYEFFVGIGIK